MAAEAHVQKTTQTTFFAPLEKQEEQIEQLKKLIKDSPDIPEFVKSYLLSKEAFLAQLYYHQNNGAKNSTPQGLGQSYTPFNTSAIRIIYFFSASLALTNGSQKEYADMIGKLKNTHQDTIAGLESSFSILLNWFPKEPCMVYRDALLIANLIAMSDDSKKNIKDIIDFPRDSEEFITKILNLQFSNLKDEYVKRLPNYPEISKNTELQKRAVREVIEKAFPALKGISDRDINILRIIFSSKFHVRWWLFGEAMANGLALALNNMFSLYNSMINNN